LRYNVFIVLLLCFFVFVLVNYLKDNHVI
jgi:hypothetical protein